MQSETALQVTKSLVADYDSSSEDDEPVNSELRTENSTVPLISASEMLSKNSSDASSSVFINPYRVAENYEQSILEKHVKMTQVKELDLKNKKLCFKFTKGKCKLGDKCRFRHVSSSDEEETMLSKSSSDASSSVFINPYRVAENYEQAILEKHVKMTQVKELDLKNKKLCFKFTKGKCKLGDKCRFQHVSSIQTSDLNGRTSDEEETNESVKAKSKKRCGLKDDLIPPKKYMKVYNKSK